MKKIILVIATIVITSGAYAQTDSTSRKMSPPDINNTNDNMNQNRDMNKSHNQNVQNNASDNTSTDGVVMQNGKMMMVKDGRTVMLEQEMTMSNGTKIMKDGTYIKKDGTKMMLKDGQHIDMSGNIVPVKDEKDKSKMMYLVPDSATKKMENKQ